MRYRYREAYSTVFDIYYIEGVRLLELLEAHLNTALKSTGHHRRDWANQNLVCAVAATAPQKKAESIYL